MAKQKQQITELVDIAKSLQSALKTVETTTSRLAGAFDLVADSATNITKQAQKQKDLYQKGYEQLQGVKSLNKDIVKELDDQAKSNKIKALALKTGVGVQIVELQLAKQQALADAQRAGATTRMLDAIREQYDLSIKQTKELVKLEKQQEKQEEYAEKIKELNKETKELLGGVGKFADTLKSIFKDSAVAAGIFIGKVNHMRETLLEGFSEIRKEGFTISQALGKTTQNVGVYFSAWGVGFKEAMEAQKGLVESLGNTTEVTAQAIGNAAQLGKTFGISEEAAGKLTGQLMNMPGATAETANNTLEFAGNLAKAAHVAPGAVMASIAGSAEEVALYSKDGGKNIAVAAVAAKKLGIEFSTITKSTEALLDFENSINKQMEASVLLGREINLDKARELSLNGDLVGATQEMLKNVGGEAEFNKMNVMQRKALADSMGVSVQELAKMVKNQDKLADLTQEQRDALAQGDASLDEILSVTGGVVGKLKDGVITLGSFVKGFSEIKEATKATLSSVFGIVKGLSGGTGVMGKFKEGFKGALGIEGAADKTKDLASKAPGGDGAAKGKGTQGFLEGLGSGLASFGEKWKDILKGALTLAGSAILIGGALVGLALAYKALGGDPMTLIGLGVALAGFGASAALLGKFSSSIMKGALAMLVLGTALIPAAIAFSMLEGVDVNSIIAFSIALPLLALAAAGLGFLIVPITIGAAALAILGAALIPFAIALRIATPAMESFGSMIVNVLSAIPPIITAVADGFVKMFGAINMDNIGPILLLGPALLGIAAGLGAMALTGLAALPVIGALTGLALVAPALTSLADSLGGIGGGGEKEGDENMKGGGGGEKEGDENMKTLITKIDELISISKQGGVVMLDGNKVGQALGYSIRRNINTSGVS